MKAIVTKVNINNVTDMFEMKVRIVGVKRFKFRLWAAVQLIRLASKIIGVGIKMDVDDGR